MEGYCLKCRKKQELDDPTQGESGSPIRRPHVVGTCPDCRSRIFRIGATLDLAKEHRFSVAKAVEVLGEEFFE